MFMISPFTFVSFYILDTLAISMPIKDGTPSMKSIIETKEVLPGCFRGRKECEIFVTV
jgi:hypothetical protein